MKRIITIAMLFCSLAACQLTTQEAQIQESCSGNWVDIGYEVALDGKPVRTFSKYEDICKESIYPNAKSEYLEGYTKGIVEYCTYESGFDLGESGQNNKKVCPHERRQDFDKGFLAGHRALAEKVNRVQKEALQKEVHHAQRSGAGR
jgi:hypothetical protein